MAGVDGTDGRSTAVQSLSRAVALLRVLGEHSDGLGISALARRTALPRSTTHRLIGALEEEQLVVARPDGRVSLGLGLLRLVESTRQGLNAQVHPFMQDLSDRLNETVDLAIRDRAHVTFLDQVVGAHSLRYVSSPGASFPVHCTANGKALLALLSDDEVDDLLPAHLDPLTPHTITLRSRLLDELAEVRESGIAFDREEYTVGVCAVGTSLGSDPAAPLALSVPVPAVRFAGREAQLASALRDTAQRITTMFTG